MRRHTRPPRRSIVERFWQKVDIIEWEAGACWEWSARTLPSGYGVLSSPGRYGGPLLAHRVSYELHYGRIPNKVNGRRSVVRHVCDNRTCVNPRHLVLGTHKDNSRDAQERNRLCTGEDHPFSKLTVDAVRDIRSSLLTGRELAVRYGVSDMTISQVRTYKTWKHVSAS